MIEDTIFQIYSKKKIKNAHFYFLFLLIIINLVISSCINFHLLN